MGRLDYINEYSFAQRLRAHLDELTECLRKDIASDSLDTFVRVVVDTPESSGALRQALEIYTRGI